ncbi:MAG: hypothetical protein IPF99_15045 [Deltaproteobacteria bacterium]|nr:hypothetical protein [Deltaproteobacteria bacterium]
MPGVDVPGVDVPGVDVPGVDVPGVDVPGVDVPVVLMDAPGSDTPAVDVPAVDTATADSADVLMGPVGEVLARDQMIPFGIALDATHVYWTNQGDGTVHRMLKDGSAPELLATGGALAVAVRGGFVYWTGNSNILSRKPVAGGTPQMLGQLMPTAVQYSTFLSLTSQYAVWGGGTQIGYVALDGTGQRRLAPLPCNGCGANGLTADETHIYWVSRVGVQRGAFLATTVPQQLAPNGGFGIVLDADTAYWGSADLIRRVPRGGGTASTLAGSDGYSEFLALDATHVYWSEGGRSALVRRAPLAGGAAVVAAVATVGRPSRIALDATHVYWADPVGGTIARAPKSP